MSSPSLLGELTTEEFREKLAGVTSKEQPRKDGTKTEVRELAIQFVSLLPVAYGEQLDRMALWSRIATAIESAVAKTVSSDTDFFAQHVFEHIKADAAKASASDPLSAALFAMGELDESDAGEFLAYIRTHTIPLIVRARARWEGIKKASKAKKENKADA